jgi:uncharacterized repeat protein (TIGR03803 family)
MWNNTSSVVAKIFLVVITLALTLTKIAAAAEKLLFDFNATDGNGPYSALIFDASGNLYGTTTGGGTHGAGTVFELTPNTKGGWAQHVLHSFNSNGIDGISPYTRLVFDSGGNLYGTTNNGGPNNVGTVFKLSRSESGTWTEHILYSFQNNEIDGTYPYGALIFDSSGNLYGTTLGGGSSFDGTVYKLTPTKNGWAETILYSFGAYGGDASGPYSGVVFDGLGNLYGSTTGGGAYEYGTVFELTPQSGGAWTENILFSFDGQNSTGDEPGATPIFDAAGNLYGTTIYGGYYDSGMVYELSPPEAAGEWTETILHSFEPSDWDGGNPFGGLVFDSSGNLYGTTNLGGRYNQGTVFEISPPKGGGWTEKLLHTFLNNGKDGRNPYGNLVFDKVGNLYGATYTGGLKSDGMVFEITN